MLNLTNAFALLALCFGPFFLGVVAADQVAGAGKLITPIEITCKYEFPELELGGLK